MPVLTLIHVENSGQLKRPPLPSLKFFTVETNDKPNQRQNQRLPKMAKIRTVKPIYNMFKYSFRNDALNAIHRHRHESPHTAIPISGHPEILAILGRSQPTSIYDLETRCLICYGAVTTFLRRAIVIPNNYELFLAPWIADGSTTYSNEAVRQDWKRWFPSAHNSILSSDGRITNRVLANSFDSIRCLLDGTRKYIVKNHDDADNYWHWTFEWLPRLFLLKELSEQQSYLPGIKLIVIGSELTSFQDLWMNLLFGNKYKVEYYRSSVLCDQLIWINPPFPGHHSRLYLDKLRKTVFSTNGFDQACTSESYSMKRIYLQRGTARNGRSIVNEDEVVKLLEKHDFTKVTMDGLNVYEQAAIFSKAEIIIGPHGSAFVNMIYCSKECKIIELFGPGYISGHDYSLAFMLGLDWQYIEGNAVDARPGFTSNYYIDVDILQQKLLMIKSC